MRVGAVCVVVVRNAVNSGEFPIFFVALRASVKSDMSISSDPSALPKFTLHKFVELSSVVFSCQSCFYGVKAYTASSLFIESFH